MGAWAHSSALGKPRGRMGSGRFAFFREWADVKLLEERSYSG